MAGVSLFTSKSWMSVPATQADASRAGFLKPLVCLAPAFLFVQYLLGGQLRHLGSGLHEHLGFAFISLVLTLVTFVATHRSGIAWLRRAAWSLLALLFVQMLLGAAAWITKFGFASTGYVAVQNSAEQTAFRTAHMVVGMLLFMNSVVLALRVFRIESLQDGNSLENRGTERELSQSALVARGGAG
jgi:heme A synthase